MTETNSLPESETKKSYHHGDLREALLAAALEILEEGIDPKTLTLRETARRAGVSAMAPYRHFADKDALLSGVAAIGFDRFKVVLAKADSHAEPREALIAQGVAYIEFALANPALFRLMFGQGAPVPEDGPGKPSSSFQIMASRAGTLVPPGQGKDWALACWSIVHGLAMLALDGRLAGRDDPPPVLAERMLRLLGITRTAAEKDSAPRDPA